MNGDIRASQQVDTCSTRSNSKQWYVKCEHGTIDVRCLSQFLDTPGGVNEVHQYELLNINSTFTQKMNEKNQHLKMIIFTYHGQRQYQYQASVQTKLECRF